MVNLHCLKQKPSPGGSSRGLARFLGRAGLAGLVLLALSAGSGWAAPAKLRVAASILPLADFCRQIGGERVEVQVLIPPGASPHTFEPSPGKLTALAQARVLVYVGVGLEPWLDKFLYAQASKKPIVVEATQGLDLITEVPQHRQETPVHAQHRHAPGHGHAPGTANPHVWLDPILAQDICRRIAAAYRQADPAQQDAYEQNLSVYLAKLADLDQTIAATTATFQRREFVSFHPSFTYFARRYQLHEVGVIEVAPGREPTPRALQNILQAIRRYNIKVIFSEPQFSPRLVEVLAREAGVRVLSLDPIGGRPPYGDDYLQLMHYNLAAMAEAMK